MDAVVQLALAAKAGLVFAADNTFLSFPVLEPVSFAPDELAFAKGQLGSAADLQAWSDFSRITNQVPHGVVFQGDQDRLLWDVYGEVLTRAVLASGGLTTAEEQARAAALAVLYDKGEDGRQVESARLLAWRRYRDQSLVLQEAYRSRQISAENAADPAVAQAWRSTDEPAMRAAIERCEADWAVLGFRAEVEAAQRVEESSAARSPILQWSEWRRAFTPDLDLLTDGLGNRFAATGFSPADAVADADWPRFTLSRAEMNALIGQAPAELAGILGSSGGADEIESLSFAFRSVALNRPWFRPPAFAARFWRLPDGEAPLCNGVEPPDGRLPAYVAALVLARDVRVEYRQGGRPVRRIPPRQLFELREDAQLQLYVRPVPRRAAAVLQRQSVGSLPGVRLAQAKLSQNAFSAEVAASAAVLARRPELAVRRPIEGRPILVRPTRPPPVVVAPPPPPTPAPSDEVALLAFICKRLPLCPNPDPALPWT
jgi:hypothetical protein